MLADGCQASGNGHVPHFGRYTGGVTPTLWSDLDLVQPADLDLIAGFASENGGASLMGQSSGRSVKLRQRFFAETSSPTVWGIAVQAAEPRGRVSVLMPGLPKSRSKSGWRFSPTTRKPAFS